MEGPISGTHMSRLEERRVYIHVIFYLKFRFNYNSPTLTAYKTFMESYISNTFVVLFLSFSVLSIFVTVIVLIIQRDNYDLLPFVLLSMIPVMMKFN